MSQRSKKPRSTVRELRKTGIARGRRGKMSQREAAQSRMVRELVNARWVEAVKVQEQAPKAGVHVLRWVFGAFVLWALVGVIYAYS